MRRWMFVGMAVLSTLVAVYAIGVYGFGPGAKILPPAFQESFGARPLTVAAHIFASATALLIGPVQFSSRVRTRWPRSHRIVGRVYLGAAVPVGGLAGLHLSALAVGGVVSTLGFGTLAVVWLYPALQGYLTARSRDFPSHRRWMIRSYALTFAAVTLRLYLPLSQIVSVPFEPVYQAISWLCWVPNLLAGEWLIRTARGLA